MSDGYYLLDALNPDEFGIGGAAGGYNLGQQVILNITPDNIEAKTPQFFLFGSVNGKISGDVLSLELTDSSDPGLQYINPLPISVTFGIEVVNSKNPGQNVEYFESEKKNISVKQGDLFRWNEVGTTVDLSKIEMPEGESYDFIISTLVSLNSDASWTESRAMPGKSNYVTVTKTATGYEVVNNKVENLEVSDFQIESSVVYLDKPVKFSATFTNPSTQELTRNYSVVLFDDQGEECYKMENYSVSVNAGSAVSETWTSVQWYKEAGAVDLTSATEFIARLYDNWQGEYVAGIEEKVTVQPTNGEAKVESDLSIVNGVEENGVYLISGNELQVSLTVKVEEGFFNHTIMLAIQAPMNDGDYFTIMHKHFDAVPALSAGEEQVFDMSVVFEDAEPDKTYRVEVWGPGSGFNESKLVRFDTDGAGIANIFTDFSGNNKIYKIDGTLYNPSATSEIIRELPSGIYIVNGKKILIR